MTTPTQLGLTTTLTGTFESVQERVTASLKEQGFGILTEIDVQKTLKTKIDVDFRPYKILGACNPHLAHRALSATSEVGLLLPCNVTLSETEPGQITVSIVDPIIMLQVVNMPEMHSIAEEARTKLANALANL